MNFGYRKVCSGCRVEKEATLANFAFNRGDSMTLMARCRECQNAYTREKHKQYRAEAKKASAPKRKG